MITDKLSKRRPRGSAESFQGRLGSALPPRNASQARPRGWPAFSVAIAGAIFAAAGLGLATAARGEEPGGGEASPGVPVKVVRYAESVIARYDQNGDRRLGAAEWGAMRGEPASIDTDGDGQISVAEYARHVVEYARRRRIRLMPAFPTSSSLPSLLGVTEKEPTAADAVPLERRFAAPRDRLAGVPDWFLSRDADGDGQLTLAEYAPQHNASALAEFARYDRNGDGVVTPQECRRGPGAAPEKTLSETPDEPSVEPAAEEEPPSDAAPSPAPSTEAETAPTDQPAEDAAPAETPRRRSRRSRATE